MQRGTDYANLAQVQIYDRPMAALRDAAAEADKILSLLRLGPRDVLLEVGTGTGAFARAAAMRCHKVVPLDVSPMMLAYAGQQAREEAIDNIEFVQAGFLTYEHHGEPSAAVVTQLALHHLPDAWKLIALKRLAGFMRRGAGLYLTDLVFPDEALADWSRCFQQLVESLPADQQANIACHVRAEGLNAEVTLRAPASSRADAPRPSQRGRGY